MKVINHIIVISIIVLGVMSCSMQESSTKKTAKEKNNTPSIEQLVSEKIEIMKKEKAKVINDLALSEDDLISIKKKIILINKAILDDQYSEIASALSDTIVVDVHVMGDTYIYTKEQMVGSTDNTELQTLFFSNEYLNFKNLKPDSQNFNILLNEILSGERSKEQFYITITRHSNAYLHEKNDEFFKVVCGIHDKSSPESDIGFGIRKINKKWQITYIFM